MSSTTFRAHCAKGHDRVDFDELTWGDSAREAFEAHMTSEHNVHKYLAGGRIPEYGKHAAPGWAKGKIQAPYPHTAPRPTPGGLAKVVERIERGDYDMPLTYTGPTVRLGEAVA